MGIPLKQAAAVARYVLEKKMRGVHRFPLVLMLEPLFACNLECAGCGKIQYPTEILRKRLTVKECADAARECGAPIVSIAGGEPLLHPEIAEIVAEITRQRRFLYLCTNAILLEKFLDRFAPSPYLTFNVHLDGMRSSHDRKVCREGVFDTAVKAIRRLRERGFRVTTNTTVFRGDDPEELRRLFDHLEEIGVDGMMISPGYAYEKAPDQENFLRREETRKLFREILRDGRRHGWNFNHSPLYLDFLMGDRDYQCYPWSNPTRNVFGWQKPCYLLGDGYARTFEELMRETDWDRYGYGRDPRCSQCMAHCGYEGAAIDEAFGSLRAGVRVFRTLLRAG
ncbi:MAG: adenosyl-hopene transferase HpnH [Candidatus Hydrogenedentota bacterium]|nr:MAG: adenosyl-hopene transferase HpnH [Candidatus Hydrogenedentota bacterium]